ncbi:hypothetical protein [Fusobacterium pseudoperiodonticum]|uniref:hypothetical protein n=1 Tax=Fusobacterium pseudoperiodonticum TaxID=2663009 RepID=UPI0028EF31E4|nr:hypothetical protein [Fusobacterium pseudoperiodonticum]
MTRSEIAAREFLKESKKATLLDVIKYKTVWLIYSLKDIKSKAKWLINLIWRFYKKYVELYDFGDLF